MTLSAIIGNKFDVPVIPELNKVTPVPSRNRRPTEFVELKYVNKSPRCGETVLLLGVI